MPFLSVASLDKRYGAERVLDGATLDAAEGETLAVLGRSGSGKTTLLRLVAGLDTPDGGTVTLAGRRLDGLAPEAREAVYLSQEPLLFPHLDVRGNVAFGLRVRRVPRAEADARVDAMLRELDLAEHAAKRADQLSGGQRQRVAFGRALAVEPRLLLLDEPFGALDAETRAQMQRLFGRVARAHGITALFVTHDLKEALVVGSRWARMEAGRVVTYDSRAAFAADAATGVADEVAFWRSVADEAP